MISKMMRYKSMKRILSDIPISYLSFQTYGVAFAIFRVFEVGSEFMILNI